MNLYGVPHGAIDHQRCRSQGLAILARIASALVAVLEARFSGYSQAWDTISRRRGKTLHGAIHGDVARRRYESSDSRHIFLLGSARACGNLPLNSCLCEIVDTLRFMAPSTLSVTRCPRRL